MKTGSNGCPFFCEELFELRARVSLDTAKSPICVASALIRGRLHSDHGAAVSHCALNLTCSGDAFAISRIRTVGRS